VNREPASTTPDPAVDYGDARRMAQVNAWREKVLIYLTRDPGELLVLEHTAEYPDAGVQVPAGGVALGEHPAQAASRELAEETGLTTDSEPVYLESRVWTDDSAPARVRHYFWMVAPPSTPDRWSHTVTAGDGDEGMLFWFTFQPRREPGLTVGYGWDSGLRRLYLVIAEA
jgi:8-oxo-dGTP diphosphatase